MMKHSGNTVIFSVISVCLVIVFSAGCQEQESSGPAVRKHQLIASQNIQLKKEIKQCRDEIEDLNRQLEACIKEKDYLQTEAAEEMNEKIGDVLNSIVEENQQLKEQIQETAK